METGLRQLWSATSTWVTAPKMPSLPIKRSIKSILGAENMPAAFFVLGME